MSSEVHEGLCFEVARAQLYAIVDKGTSDIESGRSRNAKTITEAINIFLHKSVMEGGLPFDVRQPRYNKETEAAMREARDIMSGKKQADVYESAEALFSALDN